jgi:hypothetical protein
MYLTQLLGIIKRFDIRTAPPMLEQSCTLSASMVPPNTSYWPVVELGSIHFTVTAKTTICHTT